MTIENTPKRRGRPKGSYYKVGKMDPAEVEFREKYHIPHPPQITYRKWNDPVFGELWGIVARQSSSEITNNWEIYSENITTPNSVVKAAYKHLPKGDLAIDWCTQWGTSTHQLGYSAKRVLGIETNEEAYKVAARNIAYMPEPPGNIQLHMYECDTLTLASAVSLVSWGDADIIRFGSRSASVILQQMHDQLNAHTVVFEYKDQYLSQLMNKLGYTEATKQVGIKIWHK